jgi:hypothetical protein
MIADIETSESKPKPRTADSEEQSRTAGRIECDTERRRAARVVIPLDPRDYERRRMHAQRIVDEYYGRGVYYVVGRPGEMLQVVQSSQRPSTAFG